MARIKYGILLGLGIQILATVCFFGEVSAQEQEEHTAAVMDESGNITQETIQTGIVEDARTYPWTDGKTEPRSAAGTDWVVNFNTKGNAVTNYTEVATKRSGYTNGAYGADAAFLGMEGTKVKFMLSGAIGLVDASEVQVVAKEDAKSISYYYIKSGWLYHRITWNMNESGYATALKMGKAPGYLSENVSYYSYDGHYFYTDYRVMTEDYENATRARSVNPAAPYYNYFQYLPMRSASRYTADELNAALERKLAQTNREDSKLRGIGDTVIKYQDKYGVNAFLMLGKAINESGWGMSRICQEKNNLFGLNAVDSSPNESANYFPSVDACVEEYARIWMSKGYLDPTESNRYNGGFLGNKGSGINVKYSSAPYMGETVAAILWNLDEEMGRLDQYSYTIAARNLLSHETSQAYMRAGADTNSAVIYQSSPRPNMTFLLLSDQREGVFYKIQSDAILKPDRSAMDTESDGSYNYHNMYVYSGADYMTVVSQGNLQGIDRFRDIHTGDWYYNYAKAVYEMNLITGMNPREFGATGQLARAQFATILYRMAGSPAVSGGQAYKDVPADAFYASAAMWGKENQIITGYSDSGLFGGSDMITRQQMATILYRYAQYRGYDTSARLDLDAYPDAGSVDDYAKEAMQWAVARGIISGDQGMLKPNGTAIRAESAAIIVRFLQAYP